MTARLAAVWRVVEGLEPLERAQLRAQLEADAALFQVGAATQPDPAGGRR